MKVREITNTIEIMKAFSHLQTDRSRVLLWQTHKKTKKKNVFFCELTSVGTKNIYLKPINDSAHKVIHSVIDASNKIFVRGSINGVLFKSDRFIFSGDEIQIPLPEKVVLYENRNKDRFYMPAQSSLYMKIENPLATTSGKKTSFKILDFSENGISIFFNKQDSYYFDVGKSYRIVRLAGYDIENTFTAKLIYQKVHTYIKNQKTNVSFRAGFRFSSPIPKIILDKLHDEINFYLDLAS